NAAQGNDRGERAQHGVRPAGRRREEDRRKVRRSGEREVAVRDLPEGHGRDTQEVRRPVESSRRPRRWWLRPRRGSGSRERLRARVGSQAIADGRLGGAERGDGPPVQRSKAHAAEGGGGRERAARAGRVAQSGFKEIRYYVERTVCQVVARMVVPLSVGPVKSF